MSTREKTIVRRNAEEREYSPYCMRCPGFQRMVKVPGVPNFLWKCPVCPAMHDARDYVHRHTKEVAPWDSLTEEEARSGEWLLVRSTPTGGA